MIPIILFAILPQNLSKVCRTTSYVQILEGFNLIYWHPWILHKITKNFYVESLNPFIWYPGAKLIQDDFTITNWIHKICGTYWNDLLASLDESMKSWSWLMSKDLYNYMYLNFGQTGTGLKYQFAFKILNAWIENLVQWNIQSQYEHSDHLVLSDIINLFVKLLWNVFLKRWLHFEDTSDGLVFTIHFKPKKVILYQFFGHNFQNRHIPQYCWR